MKDKKWITILLVFVLLIGLSLLLYPSVADYWNSFTQSKAIAGYVEMVADLDQKNYHKLWDEALDYNQKLSNRHLTYTLPEELQQQYNSTLNIADSGIMGYVEIPVIDVYLPIYHGTEETVLQKAVGHLEWSSLPTGGAGTHCVISGHRGLPSAKLFTDLDKVAVGDIFTMNVLDRVLTYQVDQILIVNPEETEELLVQEGKDLCTLVTCTPYGVNSHRMLVRGHRVDNLEKEQEVRITADAMIIEKMVVAPFVLVPILAAMLVGMLIVTGIQKRNRRNDS